ncbi:MAG: tetratricopeptide repeat protein [bacterium]
MPSATLPILLVTLPTGLAWVPYLVFVVVFTIFLVVVQILHLRAKRAFDRGDWDKALKYYEYTWWLFGVSTKKDVRPLFDFNLAKINAARSRPQRAIEWFLRARRVAIEVDNPLIIAFSSIEIGKLYAKLHDWDNSIKAYKEARDLSEKHPKKPYLIKILMAMADAYAEHHEAGEAEALLLEARRIADTRQDINSSINIWVALGKLGYDMGDWPRARECFNTALERAAERRGATRSYALARIWSGRLYAQQGLWDDARADLREALKAGRQLKDKGALFAATLEMGRLTCAQGNGKDGRAQLEQALKWSKDLKDQRQQVMALQALGEAFLSDDDPAQAFLSLKKATVILKNNYLPRVEALVLAGLATYYDDRGEGAQARQTLHAAEKMAKAGHAVYELVAIYDAFSAMYARAKKGDLAVAYQRKAHQLRQRLGIRAALSELYVDMPGS